MLTSLYFYSILFSSVLYILDALKYILLIDKVMKFYGSKYPNY